MDDIISRRAAIEDIKECAEAAHSNHEWDMEQGYINAIECLEELPSAEKTQLSEEDATSICKCPCEYREPCDYCPYHRHGCLAEEGLKDE